MIRKRVVVHGRVQGVFYRDSCRREARAAGVSGWVRNRADSAVEAVFEGPDDAVRQLVAWATRGPVHARVDHIDEYDEEPAGESGFTIRA